MISYLPAPVQPNVAIYADRFPASPGAQVFLNDESPIYFRRPGIPISTRKIKVDSLLTAARATSRLSSS